MSGIKCILATSRNSRIVVQIHLALKCLFADSTLSLLLRYPSLRESIGHELREKNMSMQGPRRFAGGESGKKYFVFDTSVFPAAATKPRKGSLRVFRLNFPLASEDKKPFLSFFLVRETVLLSSGSRRNRVTLSACNRTRTKMNKKGTLSMTYGGKHSK